MDTEGGTLTLGKGRATGRERDTQYEVELGERGNKITGNSA